MNDWQPLSVRRGLKPVPSLDPGISLPIAGPLNEWLVSAWDEGGDHFAPSFLDFVFRIGMAAQIPTHSADGYTLRARILNECALNDDVFLDVLDATLYEMGGYTAEDLRDILARGNSAWTVAENSTGLVLRVDESATAAAALAATPTDEAGRELREAWAKAYGLHADASDAWDHAIKAVEAVYIPLIVGKKDRANLGSVAGELKANPTRWNFPLGDVRTIEGMLRFIWPNPDRHGAAGPKPSIEDSRAVVHTAVVLVQWARDGLITKV